MISVIIPVYNVEKYLARCIDSVLAQTFIDFECILIDDGSQDNCPTICDEYAKKDGRIKIVHKENGGVSSARNIGLDIAQGEWVAFIDSDDWVDNDYLEVMYKNAIDNNCDLSLVSFKIMHENEPISSIDRPDTLLFPSVVAFKENLLTYNAKHYPQNGGWGFMFRKKTAEKLRFDVMQIPGQDRLFFWYLSELVSKIAWSPAPCYNYNYAEPTSTTHWKNKKTIEINKNVFLMIQKMLSTEKNQFLRKKIKSFEAIHSIAIMGRILNSHCCDTHHYKFYKRHLLNSLFCYLTDSDIGIKDKTKAISYLFPKVPWNKRGKT